MRLRLRHFVSRTLCVPFLFAFALMFSALPNANAQVVPLAQHVVLVIEENTSFSTAFPNGMPWLSSQAKSTRMPTITPQT